MILPTWLRGFGLDMNKGALTIVVVQKVFYGPFHCKLAVPVCINSNSRVSMLYFYGQFCRKESHRMNQAREN